jgi:hypothetical protein
MMAGNMENSDPVEFDFYGVDNCYFKLDDVIYLAVEDESDGYRSYLGSVTVTDPKVVKNLIFFQTPISRVKVDYVDDNSGFTGYLFTDVDSKLIWLKVGTSYYDDIYPCFVFNYAMQEIHNILRNR